MSFRILPFISTAFLALSFMIFQSDLSAAEITVAKSSITLSGFIEEGDRDKLAAALEKARNRKTIILTSEGGFIEEAMSIADLIIDYELDTHVVVKCESACSTILLAGKKRTMQRGSKLGYHQSGWDLENITNAYEDAPADWNNSVFEFAIWVDQVAMTSSFDNLKYQLERGVDAQFAIKTLQAQSDDMWYPRRKELLEAGVLTE